MSGYSGDFAAEIDLNLRTAGIWDNTAATPAYANPALGNGYRHITGTSDADSLKGDNQFNTIDGGAGSDELYSKDGNDTLTGGVGADTFAMTIGDRGVDHEHDNITDFSTSQGDKIQIIWEGEGDATSSFNEIGLTLQNANQPDGSIDGSCSYNGQVILSVEGIYPNSIARDTYRLSRLPR